MQTLTCRHRFGGVRACLNFAVSARNTQSVVIETVHCTNCGCPSIACIVIFSRLVKSQLFLCESNTHLALTLVFVFTFSGN